MLIILLILVDPKLALIVGFTLLVAYYFIFSLVRKYLNRIGEERVKSNEKTFKVVTEAFGASKEVKLGGLEKIYVKLFSGSAKIFALTTASAFVINQIPRFILEAVAFGSILLLILYTMADTGSFNNVIPILSLYVFTGYRLLPAAQQICIFHFNELCGTFT